MWRFANLQMNAHSFADSREPNEPTTPIWFIRFVGSARNLNRTVPLSLEAVRTVHGELAVRNANVQIFTHSGKTEFLQGLVNK